MGSGPKFNTQSGISRIFDGIAMSFSAPWNRSWSCNVSQIMAIHDQKGNAWEMESVITALQHEPSPRKGNTCHLPVTGLQPPQALLMVNPEETQNAGLPAPGGWGTYQANNFSEPWLLHLFLHRRALNFLTWDLVSWIWSLVFLSLQVKNISFSKQEQKEDKSQHLKHWQRWCILPERSI